MLVVRNCVQQIFDCIPKVGKGSALVAVSNTKINEASGRYKMSLQKKVKQTWKLCMT